MENKNKSSDYFIKILFIISIYYFMCLISHFTIHVSLRLDRKELEVKF